MKTIAFVLLSIVGAALACNTWPNGTDTKFHWWECNSGPIQYFDVQPYDGTGTKVEYPVQLTKPSIVRCKIDNPNNVYDAPNLKLTIKIWSWGTSCDWSSVPTLGLLNNLDACQHGIKCPIPIGNQTLDVFVDFSKFSFLLRLLKDDTPYQFQYELLDKASGDRSCITAQARARTK